MRSGTLNVPGIVGLGEACRLRQLEMDEEQKAIAIKRNVLQSLLLNRISGLLLHGDVTSRLSGKPHIFFIPDIPNSTVLFV
jgi:cysteine desulfurase